MKRCIVLILLFIAFNANAIEGSMMMSNAIFGIDKSSSFEPTQGKHSHHNIDVSGMSDQGDTSKKAGSHCDDNVYCGICLLQTTSAILQIEMPDVSFLGSHSFNSEHICSEVSDNYTYLLRPPRLT